MTVSSKTKQRGEVSIFGLIVTGIIVIIVFGGLAANIYIATATKRHETVKINKTERVQDGNNSKYLVYTEQGVYEDTDALFNSKFDSSDLYNQLKEGETYDCEVVGYRIHVFSSYPNLLTCSEVKS